MLSYAGEFGIPTAGIVDIDVLKEGGTPWANLLSAANIPTISHGSLATSRVAVKNAMEATGKDMKRDGGIDILQQQDKEAATTLLEQLAAYGVFVVPGGELESWLKGLGATGKGPSWLITIFEKMGEDPKTPGYLMPAENDVWAFLKKIKTWHIAPERKGIPD